MKNTISAVLLLVLSYNVLSQTSENDMSFALVQLYTSQGCSSCPSADRLLDEIKNERSENNVYVMSYHVDYWNRLGWKDPFSRRKFTESQYAYGNKFGNGRVYTPQAVINGATHFVGSNEAKLKANLVKFSQKRGDNLVILSDAVKKGNVIQLNYEVRGNLHDKTLKLALVIDSRKTQVPRGENAGRKLQNSNIVVEEITRSLDKASGQISIEIPEVVISEDTLNLIAYIQKSDLSITGASGLHL